LSCVAKGKIHYRCRPRRRRHHSRADLMKPDYSSFGLQDKIAIVTGASQGIGKAIALGLAQAGAHLVLGKHPDGKNDAINQVKGETEALGRKAIIVPTDVSDVEQVRALVQKAKNTFGRLDILVNN